MRIVRLVALVLVVFAVACDQDPLRMRERLVLGAYYLEQWEDGETYYLVKPQDQDNGGGVLGGTVVQLGWSGRYIVAERQANFRGDKGWMIIDVTTGLISGPFSGDEIRTHAEVRGTPVLAAAEAWKRLSR